MSGARVVAGFLLAAALAFAALGAARAADDPRAVAASVAHELNVQERLPSEDRPAPRRHDVSGGGAGPAAASAPALHPGGLSPVFGWVALGFALVFVAATVFDAFAGRRNTRLVTLAANGAQDGAGSARSAAQVTLASADELAAAGRYTEAIHQLLSDAVAMLRRRVGPELSDALTSREIVRTLELRDVERSALGQMVARVEQTWFAQRVAAADDYESVRASFRVFAAPGSAAG